MLRSGAVDVSSSVHAHAVRPFFGPGIHGGKQLARTHLSMGQNGKAKIFLVPVAAAFRIFLSGERMSPFGDAILLYGNTLISVRIDVDDLSEACEGVVDASQVVGDEVVDSGSGINAKILASNRVNLPTAIKPGNSTMGIFRQIQSTVVEIGSTDASCIRYDGIHCADFGSYWKTISPLTSGMNSSRTVPTRTISQLELIGDKLQLGCFIHQRTGSNG